MERFHTHRHAWTGRSPAYHTFGHPASRNSLSLVPDQRWKRGGSLNRVKPLKSPQPELLDKTSCFLSSTWFFQCEHPFIDKSMVITESAVQHMLNIDVTRFMQSLSQEHRNRTSERKTLIAGWLSGTFLCHHWKLDLLQLDHTSFLESGASL